MVYTICPRMFVLHNVSIKCDSQRARARERSSQLGGGARGMSSKARGPLALISQMAEQPRPAVSDARVDGVWTDRESEV